MSSLPIDDWTAATTKPRQDPRPLAARHRRARAATQLVVLLGVATVLATSIMLLTLAALLHELR